MALKIHDDVLRLIEELRPTLRLLSQRDVDLYRQLRRALASVSLNIGEGEWLRNGNARARFQTAMGSANESRNALRTAAAVGYVEVDAAHLDTLDRIARTLHRLA